MNSIIYHCSEYKECGFWNFLPVKYIFVDNNYVCDEAKYSNWDQ